MRKIRSIQTPTMRLVMLTDGNWYELVHTDKNSGHVVTVASDSKPLDRVWDKQISVDKQSRRAA